MLSVEFVRHAEASAEAFRYLDGECCFHLLDGGRHHLLENRVWLRRARLAIVSCSRARLPAIAQTLKFIALPDKRSRL